MLLVDYECTNYESMSVALDALGGVAFLTSSL